MNCFLARGCGGATVGALGGSVRAGRGKKELVFAAKGKGDADVAVEEIGAEDRQGLDDRGAQVVVVGVGGGGRMNDDGGFGVAVLVRLVFKGEREVGAGAVVGLKEIVQVGALK